MARPYLPDLSRLCFDIQRARLALRQPRQDRLLAVRQYAGNHYSEEGVRHREPANLLSLYISVMLRNLIAKNPRFILSTFNRQLKPIVTAMQAWGNQELVKLRAAETFQRVVIDGLFSMGILKIALATPSDAASVAFSQKAGEVYLSSIDFDDFVCDMHVRDTEQFKFAGHRYRVPLDTVRDSKLYSKARKDLVASTDQPFNLEGDERINVLGRTFYQVDAEEFEDQVDLWEIYLPRHKLILTLADDQLTGPAMSSRNAVTMPFEEPLRVQRWLGPDTGPYHYLNYCPVPGNWRGKGPVQDLIDLHESANLLLNKLIDQAERQKSLLLVAGGAMEDAGRIQQASDGDIIRTDRPELCVPRDFGGPNAQNYQIYDALKQLFAYMAGNLDMMGGLSPQSKTLGQDQLLAQNASRSVADMQDRTVSFVSEAIKAMCWYWWHDPFKTMRSNHTLQALPDISITRDITPAMRRLGAFEELDIKIDAYSMQHSTPQSRMQALSQVMQQIIMPLMPLLQQQGIGVDINAYLKQAASYLDMPELLDIATIQEPPQESAPTQGEKPGMPAQTQRTYVRQNQPGRTNQGDDRARVAAMMGQNTGGDSQRNGQMQPAGAA